MAISRRALMGLGLVGLSAAGTGAYLYLRESDPDSLGLPAPKATLTGFVGGEKMAFIESQAVTKLLHQHGLTLESKRAGSVEMVRDPALLDQKPQFIWPSSYLLDLARASGLKPVRDQVIFNSPIVLFSWEPVAKGLQSSGLVSQEDGVLYADMPKLLGALHAGTSWKDVGVPELFGKMRLASTDPNRSNSGFIFAGLAANLFADTGDVVTSAQLEQVQPKVSDLFARMGFKAPGSGKLFDDYLAGGMGAQPMIVGYENQLIEWIVADPKRWEQVRAAAPAQPVMIYPRPTVMSAHLMIALTQDATRLIDTLLLPQAQDIAWAAHGFRGALGAPGVQTQASVASSIPKNLTSLMPLPDGQVMLSLLQAMAK